MFYLNKPNFLKEIFVKYQILCIFVVMLVKTRAIVLRSIKFGDSSIIVDVFTESNGRLSFITHIGKSKTAKIKKQFFQSFAILDIECDIRPRSQLQHIKEVRFLYSFSSIPFDVYKLSISLFLSEFLIYSLKEEQANVPLFEYIVYSIKWLDQSKDRFSNFHLVFLMRLSRFLGFYPNLSDYGENRWFDLRSGCFCQSAPVHGDVLEPDEAKNICIMMRMNYETMHLYTMSRKERDRCIEVMLHYYRLHLPVFPDLKSFDVLKELFV